MIIFPSFSIKSQVFHHWITTKERKHTDGGGALGRRRQRLNQLVNLIFLTDVRPPLKLRCDLKTRVPPHTHQEVVNKSITGLLCLQIGRERVDGRRCGR